MNKQAKAKPRQYMLFCAAILVAAGAFLLTWFLKVRILYSILFSINLITFFFYGYDKHQAQKGAFRIPEAVLHFLAGIGGSPGALLAQIVFRHKTKKRQFQIIFVLIVLLQISAITACFVLKNK